MVEQTERTGGDGGPRSATGRRFEVFVREDESDPLEHAGTVAALRTRDDRLTGRCRDCAYRDICRGGSRLRAIAVHDDPFAPNPKCYLTKGEREPGRAVDLTEDGSTAD